MRGERPVTVYIRWKEQDLLALSPLVRLLWGPEGRRAPVGYGLTDFFDALRPHGRDEESEADDHADESVTVLHDSSSTSYAVYFDDASSLDSLSSRAWILRSFSFTNS